MMIVACVLRICSILIAWMPKLLVY
jgi:hypothetical protein